MGVTIKDIAQKAGVSYSTVSRALNGIGSTNGDRRKRILEIAKEMGYVPNQAAIHLKLSRSYVIGLYFSTISKMTSPFVLHDVLTGVYSIVGSKYNIVVKGIDMHEAGTLNPTYYDGIIVLSQRTEDRAFMEEVLEKKIPMVVICRKVDIDALNVTTDETKAMETAMDYLIENGHWMAECSQKTWPGSGYHSHCQRDLPVRKRVSGGKAPSGVPSHSSFMLQ